MINSLKVRLEPNNKQRSKLFQSAGAARWAYNWTISRQEENYKSGGRFLSHYDLRKELTQLKKTESLHWLNDYSNNITKQSVKDACNAYCKFFKGLAGKPKFKSRKRNQPSFYQDTEKFKFDSGRVRIEKVGWVRLSEAGRIPENVKYTNPRITFDGLNWYVSVGIHVEPGQEDLSDESVGIDVGLKSFAICSNMEEPFININKSKKVKKLEKRLRRLQRKVSKKYSINKEGNRYIKTSNIKKLEKQIRKLQIHLGNIRTDYRHKVSTRIVKTKPSRIIMESLNIRGMMKNKHLSRSIAQQGFYVFRDMLKYKSERMGIEFIEAEQWYPSSKTCSVCGVVKTKLSLSEREFKCENCGSVIDRDKNASINLSRYKAS